MFFGSTLLTLAFGVIAAIQLRQPDSGYLLAGAVLAVVAAIVTIALPVLVACTGWLQLSARRVAVVTMPAVGPGCCHRRACARRSSHPLSPR